MGVVRKCVFMMGLILLIVVVMQGIPSVLTIFCVSQSIIATQITAAVGKIALTMAQVTHIVLAILDMQLIKTTLALL